MKLTTLQHWAFSMLVFSALSVCGTPVRGQETAERLSRAVDEVFADVTKPGSPGCSVAVARDGKLLFAKGYGLANIEQNVPLAADSVFDIGSTSKQFSAASILLLEKQGKLSLQDDVRKYIPELPDYGKKVTILNLLNHTSGLRDYLVLFELAGIHVDSVTTDDEALALVSRQKALNFDPGTDWLYSNTGFFLMSVIVKRVSGVSLSEFAAANIFQPLEMTHTRFRDSHTLLIPNRALAYDALPKEVGYQLNVSYFEQTGDGAVHTTVGDLLKWDENFYDGKVGGKALVAELQEQGSLNSGKKLDYAKGLFVAKYRGLPVVRHGGAWGGYRAELLRFPMQHFSTVCVCNRSDGNPEDRANKVADIFLASLLGPKEKQKEEADPEDKKRKPIQIASAELKQFAGDYKNVELGVIYRLAFKEDKLEFSGIHDLAGLPRSSELAGKALLPFAEDEVGFSEMPVYLRFQKDATGRPVSFVLDAGRTKGMIFTRVESAR